MRSMGRNFCFLREEGKEKSEEKRKDKNFSQKQGGVPSEGSLPLCRGSLTPRRGVRYWPTYGFVILRRGQDMSYDVKFELCPDIYRESVDSGPVL